MSFLEGVIVRTGGAEIFSDAPPLPLTQRTGNPSAQRPDNRNAAGGGAVVSSHVAKLAIFPKPGNRTAPHMGAPAKEGNMIDHVSIGVRDIAKAKAFYDAALKPIGYTCLSSSEGSLGYGNEQVAFWISASPSPVPTDPQSGLHFCFTAPTRRSVDGFHQGGIRHGGRDN